MSIALISLAGLTLSAAVGLAAPWLAASGPLSLDAVSTTLIAAGAIVFALSALFATRALFPPASALASPSRPK